MSSGNSSGNRRNEDGSLDRQLNIGMENPEGGDSTSETDFMPNSPGAPAKAEDPGAPGKPGIGSGKPVARRRIYSRRGDLGETALFSGPRVGKDQKRIVAVGNLDELNSFLGLARSFSSDPALNAEIDFLQRKLFDIGTEIVALTPNRHAVRTIQPNDIQELEGKIDHWDSLLPPLDHFVMPGGTHVSAFLHVARSVCRRVERRVVALIRADETVSRRLIGWFNRLGDLLFVLARHANVGGEETGLEMGGMAGKGETPVESPAGTSAGEPRPK